MSSQTLTGSFVGLGVGAFVGDGVCIIWETRKNEKYRFNMTPARNILEGAEGKSNVQVLR